jgi:hypothetical protein
MVSMAASPSLVSEVAQTIVDPTHPGDVDRE